MKKLLDHDTCQRKRNLDRARLPRRPLGASSYQHLGIVEQWERIPGPYGGHATSRSELAWRIGISTAPLVAIAGPPCLGIQIDVSNYRLGKSCKLAKNVTVYLPAAKVLVFKRARHE